MKTIRLYGELGKKFGKVHKLYVETPSEAIRALCANFKEFRKYVTDSDERLAGYEVWNGPSNLGEDVKAEFSQGLNNELKIIPRVKGSGAAARIIAGVVLIVIGLISNVIAPGNPAQAYLYAMGAGLILGGVVTLIMGGPPTQSVQESHTALDEGYIFSGPTNTTKQGAPVAIGYGEMIVGSQVISAAFSTQDIAIE